MDGRDEIRRYERDHGMQAPEKPKPTYYRYPHNPTPPVAAEYTPEYVYDDDEIEAQRYENDLSKPARLGCIDFISSWVTFTLCQFVFAAAVIVILLLGGSEAIIALAAMRFF